MSISLGRFRLRKAKPVQIPYAAKVMSIGVVFKAIVMSTLVTVLAATTFGQSIILVLVSATATGIFGLIIVLIQVKSEQHLHDRVNQMEKQINVKANQITAKTEEAVQATKEVKEQTQVIADVVTPSEGNTSG